MGNTTFERLRAFGAMGSVIHNVVDVDVKQMFEIIDEINAGKHY